jgi:diguanylate cyclase (GGDEF)-like protein/PAS domain S-box-containing protein
MAINPVRAPHPPGRVRRSADYYRRRLRELTSVMDGAFEGAPGGIALEHIDGTFFKINERLCQMLGYTESQLIGRTWQDITHPDDLDISEQGVADLLAGRVVIDSLQKRYMRADGEVLWVELSVSLARDEDGEPLYLIAQMRDITAAKRQQQELADLTAMLEGAFKGAPGGIALERTDGTFFKVNERLCQMLGYTESELIGKTSLDITHPDDLDENHHGLSDLLAGRIAVDEREKRYVRADGTAIWVRMSVSLVRGEEGEPLYLVAQSRDITEARRQEEKLSEITARFEGAFAHTPIGMSLVGLDGSWLQVNHALCGITGRTEDELLNSHFQDITHPDDVYIGLEGLGDLLAGHVVTWEAEKRYIHPDGHTVWVALSASAVRDKAGEPLYLVAQTRDISNTKRLARELVHLADHDTLTELYNRRRFESELEQQVALAHRYGDRAALVMLDVDHFKYVNDSLGHSVGDDVISHVGRVLAGRLRETDIIARLGGDEFAAILHHVDAVEAQRITCELVGHIEANPFVHADHPYLLSASAGVVMLQADTASAEDAMVEVDIALYEAKQSGRNRACVYCPDNRANVLEGLTWSQRLRDALANDKFELHAQPIVNLKTGATEMFELLIRMRLDSGDVIPPGVFLEPAARFGYMADLDRWVIARAASMAAACPGRKLTVNLAGKTLTEPGLVEYVVGMLGGTGANPADLVFEVSETDVIANLDHARETCEKLRALGCAIALDDFGSGFSGFSYLKALHIDLLKIDGQFIRGLGSNEIDRLVVRAILDVAHGLGLPTVAEFVTDDVVAGQCRRLGATYGQGFHFAQPAPLDG